MLTYLGFDELPQLHRPVVGFLNQPSASLHLQVISGWSTVASADVTMVETRVSQASHASVVHVEQAPKRFLQA